MWNKTHKFASVYSIVLTLSVGLITAFFKDLVVIYIMCGWIGLFIIGIISYPYIIKNKVLANEIKDSDIPTDSDPNDDLIGSTDHK